MNRLQIAIGAAMALLFSGCATMSATAPEQARDRDCRKAEVTMFGSGMATTLVASGVTTLTAGAALVPAAVLAAGIAEARQHCELGG